MRGLAPTKSGASPARQSDKREYLDRKTGFAIE